MRYVIMANGRGQRWHNYGGVPKHLICVDGETLLARTTRLVHELDDTAEVYISSSNPKYETPGAILHSPEKYIHELDRFCYELITDNVTFLYGDAFYTKEALRTIVSTETKGITFFGNSNAIFGVKAADGELLKAAIDKLFDLIGAGELEDAKGWTLYHLVEGMSMAGKEIRGNFTHIEDITSDFNYPSDWDRFQDVAHLKEGSKVEV